MFELTKKNEPKFEFAIKKYERNRNQGDKIHVRSPKTIRDTIEYIAYEILDLDNMPIDLIK